MFDVLCLAARARRPFTLLAVAVLARQVWPAVTLLAVAFAAAAVCMPAAAAAPAAAQPRFDLRSTETRLAKTVLPSHVRLSLDVDPALPTFSGVVSISVRVLKTVPAVVLHAKNLQADRAELVPAQVPAGRSRRKLLVLADAATSTWRLQAADGRPIARGAYRIEIRYRGAVNATGEGLYRALYRAAGQPAQMLATQLEAVEARRLLPVFDEPVFRSVFELTVRAPSGWQVLANMPLHSAVDEGATVRHRYAPTPPMPSYLLALAVGRFDVLEDRVDGVPLRIFTAVGKREQARWAMEVTRQLLPFYARYFGRPYALPKLDQLAVPGTRQGAMEDWGLISYVEDLLLSDPATGSEADRRRVFGIIAHEIAHQWFGNLVSAASWNEIWLNEAFATWMEVKAAEHFHPEWQSALRQRRSLDATMGRDATAATRAIRSGPVSEASVFEVFDTITYDKGGAVLTMLEQWIGAPVFQRGLAAYMAERAFKPASAGDLWFHIGRAARQPVAEVAASWTDQPGLPLVQVSARCEAGSTVVMLRQSRFSMAEPLAGGPWRVPVRLARGDEQRVVLLDQAEQRTEWPDCNDRPLRVNAGGRGFYRAELDAEGQARMSAAFVELDAADRVALVSDSYALAEAGRRPMAAHLQLMSALPQVQDASRAPLYEQAAMQWRSLDTALAGTAAEAPLRAAGQSLFSAELNRLGWQPATGEDSETSQLRASLVGVLSRLRHAPTFAAARERFAAALAPAGGVPPSIRAALIAAVGADASPAEFETLFEALRATESQAERRVLIRALTAGRDAARAQRVLDESLAGRLPPNLAVRLPGAVAEVPALQPMAYDFVLTHWAALAQLAGDSAFGGRHWLLPGAASSSNELEMARRMQADQQRLDGAAGASTAAQVAAAITTRARLREREAADLATALGTTMAAPAALR